MVKEQKDSLHLRHNIITGLMNLSDLWIDAAMLYLQDIMYPEFDYCVLFQMECSLVVHMDVK